MSHPTVTIPAGQPIPEAGVEPDGIDTPTLAMWGFVSVVIVLAVMFGAAAVYFDAQRRIDQVRVVAPDYKNADMVITDQQGVLNKYGAPTAEGKPFQIPIDRAEELVLSELQSKASD